MRRHHLVVPAALALGIIASAPASAQNLISNGDFSAGATGFTSTYSSVVSGATADQGSYAATTNPYTLCSVCFPSVGDHTTGTGNMLFIDSAGTNPDYFWSQTFAVAANTDYDFSIWATSLGFTGPIPALRVVANGTTIVGPVDLPYTTGVTATTWNKYAGTWSSGGETSVTLQFFSNNLGYPFNDFAIDDASFTAVAAGIPEPATWAAMICGFGLIGGLARRRKQDGDVLTSAAEV